MTPLTVFAIIEAPEADLLRVQAAVAELARHSAGELGCLQYDVHLSVKSPARLIIHEIWAGAAALECHRGAEHVARFRASLDGTTARVWASQFQMLE